MILESEAFRNGERIPPRFTCDGADVSPRLAWREAPADAVTFALVVDDPDAPMGTWVHWVAFNLPAETSSLGEGVGAASLPAGTVQGTNTWRRQSYGGPCPPSGTHRYFFKLYALDSRLDLGADATSEMLATAMRGHILAEATLMGRYART